MKVTIPPIYERLTPAQLLQSDSFGRNEYAQNLISLFRESSAGLVLTITSNWGDGKTTFIRTVIERLRRDKQFIPIYFDAFQNDFSGDAFLSIATLIHQTLLDRRPEYATDTKNKKQFELLATAAKRLAMDFAMMGAGMAISSLSGGVIDKGRLTKLTEGLKKAIFGVFTVDINQKYQAHLDSQKNISAYRDKLNALLMMDGEEHPKKIVFFVDELDRCRPDFAVEVIEKIKHLFAAKNVYFVLAINHGQLMRTIANAYGVSEDDAAIYMHKFVHIETRLPPMELAPASGKPEQIAKYLRSLAKEFDLQEYLPTNSFGYDALARFVSAELLGLNPRGIERMFSLISVGLGSTSHEVVDVPHGLQYQTGAATTPTAALRIKIITAMAALRIGRPQLYERWKGGSLSRHLNSTVPQEEQIWTFLRRHFERPEGSESHHFTVTEIPDLCRVLDIYEFPPEIRYVDIDEKGKSAPPKEDKRHGSAGPDQMKDYETEHRTETPDHWVEPR